MPDEPATVEAMADDAAAVLRALEIPSAHVAGFSGGSIIAQELALGHPELVRSLVLAEQLAGDGLLPPLVAVVRSLAGRGSPERARLPRGVLPGHLHGAGAQRGMVDQIIEEVLAFPHKQSTEDLQAFLDAFLDHDTTDRLPEIAAPTLVIAGGRDPTSRPELCRTVADLIPDAQFEVMERRPTSPSRRCRTNGTPASTASGARSRAGLSRSRPAGRERRSGHA